MQLHAAFVILVLTVVMYGYYWLAKVTDYRQNDKQGSFHNIETIAILL